MSLRVRWRCVNKKFSPSDRRIPAACFKPPARLPSSTESRQSPQRATSELIQTSPVGEFLPLWSMGTTIDYLLTWFLYTGLRAATSEQVQPQPGPIGGILTDDELRSVALCTVVRHQPCDCPNSVFTTSSLNVSFVSVVLLSPMKVNTSSGQKLLMSLL